MNLFSRRKARKSGLIGLGIGLAAYLVFSVWRGQRLLGEARQIAAHSATFSRDYQLGSGPLLTYLAMGDSTAAGWGAHRLEATYPHQVATALAARGWRVRVVNIAVGGATLAQVRQKQSAYLKKVQPDFVTISAGANDATRGTRDADFERELRLLWAVLQESRAKIVLVANVPDMFRAPALPLPLAAMGGARARGLNKTLAKLPFSSKIQTVDLFGRGKLDYGRDAGLYAADLFHPSGRGYGVWAALFVEKLRSDALALGSAAAKGR